MKSIGVLGDGAWGTAVANLLANNGLQVRLWCRNTEVAHSINQKRINERYLPGIQLSTNIRAVTDIKDAVENQGWVFAAIPTQFLRSVLEKAQEYYQSDQGWVLLSKGIEEDTLFFPTQIIDDVFKTAVKKAVVAGPSFADDVARKQITAVIVAADNCDISVMVQTMLANAYFRPYLLLDVIGVQCAAAVKNVIALAIGLAEGSGYTDNTKSYLITRGMREMVIMSQALGGQAETVFGLAGLGDLVLTSLGKLSRNVFVGRQLAAGNTLESIIKKFDLVPEGINTTKSVHALLVQKKLDMPLCAGIYDIVFKNKTIRELLTDLMAQPLERECMVQ